jgi:hypothetical protein
MQQVLKGPKAGERQGRFAACFLPPLADQLRRMMPQMVLEYRDEISVASQRVMQRKRNSCAPLRTNQETGLGKNLSAPAIAQNTSQVGVVLCFRVSSKAVASSFSPVLVSA